MRYYLIICRSVTYAQRAQKALEEAGIRSRMLRSPKGLTERGCAYALQVKPSLFSKALTCLYEKNIKPYRAFAYDGKSYTEVRMS